MNSARKDSLGHSPAKLVCIMMSQAADTRRSSCVSQYWAAGAAYISVLIRFVAKKRGGV